MHSGMLLHRFCGGKEEEVKEEDVKEGYQLLRSDPFSLKEVISR